MKVTCVHCGCEHELVVVGFKAACESCGRYLHSCIQCRLYDESRKCRSNTTEPVRDVEHTNFCEEYQPANPASGGRVVSEGESAKGRFDELFGGSA